MCGVCGLVSFRGQRLMVASEDRIAAMMAALEHRGPDDQGVETERGAVLGATRLAIRGLDDGRQPLVDRESGVVVVCNGEIDNHWALREWLAERGRPVRGSTDVAVIPALYRELGERFVERLVGAFAVAIWDARESRLLLARDRAGERHLFYAVGDGVATFATELAAFTADARSSLTLDPEALRSYLRFGSFAAPMTPFAEVRKVAPAEIVHIGADGVRRRRYWRWREPARPAAPVPAPTLARFDTIFREAVRRQSEVDVPYGVFLSGGIDSSLVAAVARAIRPGYPLTAFTLRFGEPSFDEGSAAERVAAALGIRSEAVWVTPEMLPDELAELIACVGEPLADPAWIPTALLARRAARDVKLVLVGEGADELFGGYPTYIGALVSDRYARLPAALRALIARGVRRWPPSDRKVTLSFLLKKFIDGAEMEGVARHLLWTSNIAPAILARLGVPAPAAAAGPAAGDAGGAALLDLLQRHDLESSLAEGLLTKADRAGMKSALELRAPFLDRDVLEFAATLPPRERVRGITTKVFLKRYAARYLPREIVHRRKRGLSVPLARWLREPLADWARDRLGAPRLAAAGVDARAALALFDEHRARRADHARALWTLIVLSEWLGWLDTQPCARGADADALARGE
ncbi:MAG TPA: asparagine synthase (glutamine-hydrolyzing) [Gemmatimonadaceae bacterium]|nr:asparagine synthase (glutamine-hydrolyzing) [Gemmatimonadaceae bacterium]